MNLSIETANEIRDLIVRESNPISFGSLVLELKFHQSELRFVDTTTKITRKPTNLKGAAQYVKDNH